VPPTATATPATVAFAVTPIAECIDVKQDGEVLAHFGYQNAGPGDVFVAIGADNFVSPGAVNQGQPSLLLRGRINNAFTVSFPSTQSLQWVLGNARATATISTERCEGSNIECTEEDITSILRQLDNSARVQRNRVAGMAQRSLLYTKRDAVSAAKARSLVTKAEKLYLAQWRDIWSSFPQVVKTCVGAACVSVDKADDIAALQSRSRSFVSLARQAAALLKKVSRSRQSRLANEWLKSVLQINDKSRLKSSELPRFKSEC
jgi:hypothetical protein